MTTSEYHLRQATLADLDEVMRLEDAGDELYVSSMTIDPACRGSGLGAWFFTACIDHVSERFPNVSSVLLLVSAEWQPALKIYRRAGFREVASLAGFFSAEGGAAAPGLVMRKAL